MGIEVKLKTISPVSWGWYNQNADPLVVRIPSIRGSLRKWYRWYLASRDCEAWANPQKVREEEAKVFGTVHGGARRSAVKLTYELYGRREIKLSGGDPFLWALRKREKIFYDVEFGLIAEATPSEEALIEFSKALALNVSLGGFGFRSNRGYGSMKIIEVNSGNAKAREILEKAKSASNALSSGEWANNVRKLMGDIGISHCEGILRAQALSNSYLVAIDGCNGWGDCLRRAESNLKIVERALRIGAQEEKEKQKILKVDYRAFLGMPIIDPSRRRRIQWKEERRSSPLILGLSGNATYVRGILMPSSDYPDSYSTHLEKQKEGYNSVVQKVMGKMKEHFKIRGWKDDKWS